jgi:predicted DCC family thiol-disulfide oxidoreductase YuxK
MAKAPDRILIYDAECRLCVSAKERLERGAAEQDIRFVAYQSEEAVSRLGDQYIPGRPGVAYLVDRRGRVQAGLDAFLALLPGLPAGHFLAGLARLPLVRPLALLAYRLIARYRYRWFGAVKRPRQ